MEGITSSSVSDLILAYPLLVDKIPMATPTPTLSFSHWVGLQPPSTHDEPWCQGARAAHGGGTNPLWPSRLSSLWLSCPEVTSTTGDAQPPPSSPPHSRSFGTGKTSPDLPTGVLQCDICTFNQAQFSPLPTFFLSLPFLDCHTARLQV